jgi:hypothetical protein
VLSHARISAFVAVEKFLPVEVFAEALHPQAVCAARVLANLDDHEVAVVLLDEHFVLETAAADRPG